MSGKKQHAMPTVTFTPTARSTTPHEFAGGYCYAHPEGDGQMFVDVPCVGADLVLMFNDLEEIEKFAKVVNEAIAGERENRS